MEEKYTQNTVDEYLPGRWILWRWIGDKTFHESYVHETHETPAGEILVLSYNNFLPKYPAWILRKEIQIIKVSVSSCNALHNRNI